jgi:neutral ceramidase
VNGCVGYVPTLEALNPATGGSYETRLSSYTNLEPTAGPQMVQAGLMLARAMRPGSVPPYEKPAPFKQPWTYGNLPPELK